MSEEQGGGGSGGGSAKWIISLILSLGIPASAGTGGGVIILTVVIICGLAVLLLPLVILYLLFHGLAGPPPSIGQSKDVIKVAQGDGKGDLDSTQVPEDLVDSIDDAGDLCDAIGPIVIASQLETASHFKAKLVGDNGEKGISQLPPDVFRKYGKDEDDNDKTDAFDTADSIMAQGRYMCDLADQIKELKKDKTVKGDLLDLTLAAYKVGIDKVTAAGKVPKTNEVQGYIGAIRFQFAKYGGEAPLPSGFTPGVTPSTTVTADPDKTDTPDPGDTSTTDPGDTSTTDPDD